MSEGETRTSRKRRSGEVEGVGTEPCPVHCTGKEAPFPTTMREEDGDVEDSIPELPAMCEDAPVEHGSEDYSDRPVSAWYSAGGKAAGGAS